MLPTIDLILLLFQTYKEKYASDTYMEAMFNAGWRKIEKYYKKSYKSPVYFTVIVLNPNFK